MAFKNYYRPNNVLLVIFSVFIIFNNYGCKSKQIKSDWASEPIEINGKISDWEKKPVIYFKDQNALLSVCNDSSNLYIQFRTKDHMWAKTIKMSGLTIYADGSGNKNKNFSIKFTGGPSQKELQGLQGNMSDQMSNKMTQRNKNMMADIPPQLICYDKEINLERLIPLDGNKGPAAAYDTSYAFYVYEFSIPISDRSINHFGINGTLGKSISLGAEWGDVKKSMPDKSKMNNKGGRGGGGGGHGGGQKGEGGNRPNLPQKQEIWLNVLLADVSDSNN